MRTRKLAGAALVLAVLAGGASAGDPPPIDLDAPAAKEWLRTDYYGVYTGDARVGWMRRSLERDKFGGVDVIARSVEVHLDVAGDGNGVTTSTRTVFAADGDQLLLSARTESTTQARRTAREIVRNGLRFDVTTERRGERTEGAVAACRVTLADEVAFERLAALATARAEGPAGAAVRVAALEFSTLTAGTRTFTVTGASATGDATTFDVAIAAGPIKETATIDAHGSVVEGTLNARFRYRRVPESVAKDESHRVSLERLSRVPMDAKLAPVASIRSLVLAWDQPTTRAVFPSARQKVRTEEKSLVVEIQRDADGPAADEDAVRDALADEPGLDLSDPLLGQTAAALLAGTKDRGPQAARILEFTAGKIEYAIVLGTPGAAEILRSPKPRGDCTEHARLFVALCRTAGIPARTVEGLAWMGDDAGAFGWHQWAEVALQGKWVAMDPTSGANPVPATHLVVDATPEGRTLLWGAKFRVVGVERDPVRDAPPK